MAKNVATFTTLKNTLALPVCNVCASLGIPKEILFPPEEEISGAALLALNDRMVQQLVKKIGHQAVLMDLIEKSKQNSQEQKSLGSPKETAAGTGAEAALG